MSRIFTTRFVCDALGCPVWSEEDSGRTSIPPGWLEADVCCRTYTFCPEHGKELREARDRLDPRAETRP